MRSFFACFGGGERRSYDSPVEGGHAHYLMWLTPACQVLIYKKKAGMF